MYSFKQGRDGASSPLLTLAALVASSYPDSVPRPESASRYVAPGPDTQQTSNRPTPCTGFARYQQSTTDNPGPNSVRNVNPYQDLLNTDAMSHTRLFPIGSHRSDTTGCHDPSPIGSVSYGFGNIGHHDPSPIGSVSHASSTTGRLDSSLIGSASYGFGTIRRHNASPIGSVSHGSGITGRLDPWDPSFSPAIIGGKNQGFNVSNTTGRNTALNAHETAYSKENAACNAQMPFSYRKEMQSLSSESSHKSTEASPLLMVQYGEPERQSAVINNNQSAKPEDDGFKPTAVVMYVEGFQREPTAFERVLQLSTNMSPNYHGDPGNIWNYSNTDLPNEDNCNFWIKGLPFFVTIPDILSSIRDCGHSYAIHINREKVAQFGHTGCKLVFFDRAGARRFWFQYGLNQQLQLTGYTAYIQHNRNKVAEQFGLSRNVTRCLKIGGPPNIVHPESLFNFWKTKFKWEIDQIIAHPSPYLNDAMWEIRVGSYRAQESIAFKILNSCKVYRDANISVEFVCDPCDI